MSVQGDFQAKHGDAVNVDDFYWYSDPEKLHLLADWFDLQDEIRGGDFGTDVQDDLRRMAFEMEDGYDGEGWAFWLLLGVSFFLLAVFFLA